MTDVNDMSEERAITVLTCRGDVSDPSFPRRLQKLVCKLHRLVNRGERRDEFQVTKVEPWNSVRVTFNIPREAAERLQRLAESGDRTLHEMGVLSVQIDGDQIITITLANSVNLSLNSAITELGVTTNNTTITTSTSAPPLRCNTTITDPSPSSSSSPPSSLHRIHSADSSSSPTSSLRDVCKNIHQTLQNITTAATASRSASVPLFVSPSRGLSAPPTPPDSVCLESRPESASLEESINSLSSADPLKSQQLLHSSSSLSCIQFNTNRSATNNSNSSSFLVVQQSQSTTDQYHSNRVKDPNMRNDFSGQMTTDVLAPPLAPFLRNESPPSFRSPNVLMTDPLHILPPPTPPPNAGISLSSSPPSLSPSVSSAMVLSAIVPQQPLGIGGGKKKNSSQSGPGGHNLVSAPFPFISMQHAMHTKQGNSNYPRSTPPHHHHHLVVSPPDKSRCEVDSRRRSVDVTPVPSSHMTLCSSTGPVVATFNSSGSSSIIMNRSGPLSEMFHTAAAKSASSNVALTSPLLVNLLQNESSQITTTTECKSSLKLSSSSTKTNVNWNDQRASNDPSSDQPSVSFSLRSKLPSGLPKQQHCSDLNPINDLQAMMPATTFSVTSSSEFSASSQVVTHCVSKTVSSSLTCNSRNDISVRSPRRTNAENASTSHSVIDMVLPTMAADDRNGTAHHDEEDMDQDVNNHDQRDANSLVDADRGRRVDRETDNTRNDVLKHRINCHPSCTGGENNASSSSNHGTESMEKIPIPSHTAMDDNNAHNQQLSVNGKYDVLSEDEDDDDDEVVGDEEVLDDVDLDDEMSDLPPLEPADMAMDIDNDCDSSELCNTSTTPNILNCFLEEAVSLGSLDGRQVYSVASGDHNYISVKIESDAIFRSNSARSDHREMDLMNETSGGVDPSLQHPTSHSDLELRPNFNKCSNQDSVKKIKSDKDDSVNESGSLQNKHLVTGHYHSESSTAKVETIVTINNCHSKREEDSGVGTGGNSRKKSLHRDKVATKKNQSGVNRKLLSTDKPDSTGLECKVNSSKMRVTSESLSADIFLVNSIGNPIQPDAQTTSMVENEEEFFNQSESNHAISQAAVSILKKKKSKGSGGGQQAPDLESGMVKNSRRIAVKSEGEEDGGGTNNRL